MKKAIIGLLVLLFLVSMLAGCGSSNPPDDQQAQTPGDTASAPPSDPVPDPKPDPVPDPKPDPVPDPDPDPEPEETPSSDPASGGNTATLDTDGAIVTLELPGEEWNSEISTKGTAIYVFIGTSYNANLKSVTIKINEKSYGYGTNGEVTELANRTIGGIDMEGRSYEMGGKTFVEYLAPISDSFKTCVQITLDPEDADVIAILDSIQFTPK